MIRFARIFAIILALGLCAAGPATQPATQPVTHEDRLFSSPATLYTVRVHLPAAAWQMMQPTRGTVARRPKAVGPTTRPHVEGEKTPHGPGGNEYAYVRATVSFEHAGRIDTLADVAIRLKGNASYSTSTGVRRPFKLDFDRFSPGREFAGHKSLNLHNNSMDTGEIRESLAYWVFRDAGLPAPRTASAMVYLTIDGMLNNEYLGYYDMVEEVDSRFLKRHFGSSAGLLLKPEGFRGIPFLGETWAPYELRYNAKAAATPAQARRVIEFVKLVNQADDATFRSQLRSYLNLDNFLRYLAANVLVANLDSFLSTGHNYYFYLNPNDNLLYFIPWDTNLSFGAYTWPGTGLELASLSITHPHTDFNRLIDRTLAVPEFNLAYRKHLAGFTATCFSPAAMQARLASLESVLSAAGAAAASAGRAGNPSTRPSMGLNIQPPSIRQFVDIRIPSVLAQLDGKSTGFVASFNRAELMPPGIGLGSPLANHLMKLIDTDGNGGISRAELAVAVRRFYALVDTQNTGHITPASLTAALATLMPPPPAIGPAHRLSNAAWTQTIFLHADANRDDKLTLDELLLSADRQITASDRDLDDILGLRELVETVNRMAPPH